MSGPAAGADFFQVETARFRRNVHERFSFLVEEHGFEGPLDLEESVEHYRDRRVMVRYLGRKAGVGVEVELRFADPSLGVALIELEHGEFPGRLSFYGDKGCSRGVSLDSLVEHITKGAVPPLLPNWDAKSSTRAIGKAMTGRKAMIERDMEGLLAKEAERLREYGGAALKGDFSLFPEVARLHREKYWGD